MLIVKINKPFEPHQTLTNRFLEIVAHEDLSVQKNQKSSKNKISSHIYNINNNKLLSELYALIFVLLKQKCTTMKTLYSDTVTKIVQSAKNAPNTVPIRTRRNLVNILVFILLSIPAHFQANFTRISKPLFIKMKRQK